ncbi:TetR/AcrR family transcriptional regulator [Undibacterium sp. SXout11W]|uniref:TetR/AcrR family transcriptional regulator n=1 Tax=Undibacterium sp. SXout11W TaxID=3413050 RepID=UPI003BEF63C1
MTQQQRQTDRKREAILQAAITEFRQNGYEATSMDKIAATAAVSKRTVYNHFPSKEELFSAILMQLWQSAITSELVTYADDIDMQQQLEKYLTRKMAMLCDQNFLDLARVAVAATIHAPDRARDMVEKLSKNEPSIVTWIKAAQNDGKLRVVEPTMMADMLLGQIKALAFWPQVAMGQPILTNEQQRALIETAAKMFMQFYST